MSATIHTFASQLDTTATAETECDDAPQPEKQPFSCDMFLSTVNDFVLIDACVPAKMAIKFLAMLIEYRDEAIK